MRKARTRQDFINDVVRLAAEAARLGLWRTLPLLP